MCSNFVLYLQISVLYLKKSKQEDIDMTETDNGDPAVNVDETNDNGDPGVCVSLLYCVHPHFFLSE